MAERLSFDTSFLIDLEREKWSGRRGRAFRFLEEHFDAIMLVSAVTVGEFAEGFNEGNKQHFDRTLAALEILDVDAETGLLYGQNSRRLRRAGRLIGTNDLWIGCAALRHRLPLVTRNVRHFKRIENLQIVEY